MTDTQRIERITECMRKLDLAVDFLLGKEMDYE